MEKFIDEIDEPLQRSVTPTLTDLFKIFSENLLSQINVCIPAIVKKYYHNNGNAKVDAEGIFQKKYKDGKTDDAPLFYSVPVAHLRGSNSIIAMPLSAGDKVLLLFSDRSIDNYLQNGKKNYPQDLRKHDLSDAIALPCGLFADNEQLPLNNPSDIIIKNKSTEMRIKKNGRLQILNENAEFFKSLYDYMRSDLTGNLGGKIRAFRKVKSFIVG